LFSFSVFANLDSVSVDEVSGMSLGDLLNLQVQVSSTHGENIFSAPSSTTIIGRRQIEAFNFRSVTDLVNTISGVSVYRTYLKRNVPTVRGILQDHYANKVLLLIDGVPVWNAVTGEGNLDRIPIQEVERVEILKGPASVMYGTNAYTGAINIVLKRSSDFEASVLAGVGTGETYTVGGTSAFRYNDVDIMVGAFSEQQVGEKEYFEGEDSIGGYLNEFVSVRSSTLHATYKSHSFLCNTFSSEESYLGSAPCFSYGAGNPHQIGGSMFHYRFSKKINHHLGTEVGCTFDYTKRTMSRNQVDSIRAGMSGYRASSEAKFLYRPLPIIHSEFGLHYEYRRCNEYRNYHTRTGELVPIYWSGADTLLAGDNNMTGLHTYETSGFGQVQITKNWFSSVIGARYTYNESYESNLSSRLAFVFNLSTKSSIKAIYGESFRSPSFFETDFFYSTVLGNEKLEPEKSKSFELSYSSAYRHFFFQALLYKAYYDNVITREMREVNVGDSIIAMNRYENGQAFSSQGAEIEVRYMSSRTLVLFLQYCFIYGAGGSQNSVRLFENAKYVPAHAFSAGVSKTVGNMGFSVIGNYIGASEGPVSVVESSLELDCSVFYRQKVKEFVLKHALNFNNITDATISYPEYVRHSGLNQVSAGKNLFIGYSLSLTF